MARATGRTTRPAVTTRQVRRSAEQPKPNLDLVRALAKDLTTTYPRSPRALLGGYVIAGRCADKARAELAGTNGDYTYWPCSLCKLWFDASGITPARFKAAVATGMDDEALGHWITRHSRIRTRAGVIRWNNRMRELRLSSLPQATQHFMEGYIAENLPAGKPVYVYFDVYDIEEQRQ